MEIVADPLALLADWLADAVAQAGYNHDAMALATTDADGQADVRFVLLKKVSAEGLDFFTNRGSSKAVQILANPQVAASLYWPGYARQVRVRGRARELDREQVAAYFATRSRSSQLGAWASKQSTHLDELDTLHKRAQEFGEKYPGQIPLPKFWTGFRIVPQAIEFWVEGEARLHERIVYELVADKWQARRLYP